MIVIIYTLFKKLQALPHEDYYLLCRYLEERVLYASPIVAINSRVTNLPFLTGIFSLAVHYEYFAIQNRIIDVFSRFTGENGFGRHFTTRVGNTN